ncbi:MAG: AAA family ATPase, partial [Bacteroidia bacterium]|nr:AAA family ATPase [Bacteroidia bacterium]
MKNLDEMIAFPYGLSNFRDIVREGYYFVDKTYYLELLEKFRDKLISFLRPRRIGKSLFVSILEYYYGKEHQDKFQELFGQYYIGQTHPLAN